MVLELVMELEQGQGVSLSCSHRLTVPCCAAAQLALLLQPPGAP